ncbi:hypothetical protein CSAL01_12947 [Colletotrichum salicis]|uniref:Uncharacterized protein n=1 Tax=Colletotrichum salicis TaxID=1209931 RepID=A0A135V1Y3_9PEZI|nr:hypothetical protein CSAL01_12947 [Colletotrichum salicis]
MQFEASPAIESVGVDWAAPRLSGTSRGTILIEQRRPPLAKLVPSTKVLVTLPQTYDACWDEARLLPLAVVGELCNNRQCQAGIVVDVREGVSGLSTFRGSTGVGTMRKDVEETVALQAQRETREPIVIFDR